MLRGRQSFLSLTSVIAISVTCLSATACGTASTARPAALHSPVSTDSGVASASSQKDPLAGMTGKQIEAEAIANIKAATGMTMDVDLSSGGKRDIYHLAIKPGQGCVGTIGQVGAGSYSVVVIGATVYVKPDAVMWKAHLADSPEADAGVAEGKYLTGTSFDVLDGGKGGVCNLSFWLMPVSAPGNAVKGAFTTIDGTRVLTLKDPAGLVEYVTDTSKPEIAGFTIPAYLRQPASKITFSFGPVVLAAPPSNQVMDGSKSGW